MQIAPICHRVDGDAHVARLVGTSVQIAVVFRDQVDVVIDKALLEERTWA